MTQSPPRAPAHLQAAARRHNCGARSIGLCCTAPAGPSRTQRSAVAGCGSPGSQFWQLSRLKASPCTAGSASSPSTAEKPIHTSRLLQAGRGGEWAPRVSRKTGTLPAVLSLGAGSSQQPLRQALPLSPSLDGETEAQRDDLASKATAVSTHTHACGTQGPAERSQQGRLQSGRERCPV